MSSSNNEEYRAELQTAACRVATTHSKVLHSECAYTFHTPFTSSLLLNLETFLASIPELALTSDKTKGVFVRIRKERVLKKPDGDSQQQKEQPTVLGVGGPDGFTDSDNNKYETVTTHDIVLAEKTDDDNGIKIVAAWPYTADDTTTTSLPPQLRESVDSILHHSDVQTEQDVKVWQLNQDDIPISKYAADLPFVDNGVTIDPNPDTWKCQKDGTTADNVWLNLSDGYMGGGRQHWDGTGGSNGALDHYKETGSQYPLVVKLGTITGDDVVHNADCYSYAPDEDGPVRIPNLAELLAKRGIQVAGMYVLFVC